MTPIEDIDDILEKLSQEERLKLLERLIQGASQAREESLSVEERLERLENIVLNRSWDSHRHRLHVIRMRGGRRHAGGDVSCDCC